MVVRWRLRYCLRVRNLSEMMLERGFEFTHEAVRSWEERYALLITQHLRRQRRGRLGKSRYVDETYIKVKGKWRDLWLSPFQLPLRSELFEHRELRFGPLFGLFDDPLPFMMSDEGEWSLAPVYDLT